MIELTGSSLRLDQMKAILYEEIGVTLNKEALDRVTKVVCGGENCAGRSDRLWYKYRFW